MFARILFSHKITFLSSVFNLSSKVLGIRTSTDLFGKHNLTHQDIVTIFWLLLWTNVHIYWRVQMNSMICCWKTSSGDLWLSWLWKKGNHKKDDAFCVSPIYSCASQANPHYALPHTSPRWVTHHPAPLSSAEQFHHPKKKLSGYCQLRHCNAEVNF